MSVSGAEGDGKGGGGRVKRQRGNRALPTAREAMLLLKGAFTKNERKILHERDAELYNKVHATSLTLYVYQ